MNFKECIDGAVAGGRLSQERAEKAKQAFDEDFERSISEGFDESAAQLHAAKASTESISNLNATRRWQKVKQMQAAYTIEKRIINADDPARELEHIMAEVEDNYDNVRGVALSFLDNMLQKYKPRALRTSRTDGLDDVVKAAYGKEASAEAKADAKAIGDMVDLLRKWANQHGANIPDSPNNRIFQTHDAVKVSNARVYKLQDGTTTNTWVEDHLQEGIIDWEVMRFDGKLIPAGQRREALARTYEGIISDGAMRDKYVLEAEGSNLASRLSRDRFIHYAGPEAWTSMQGKYGAGNLFEQTIGMVDHMAKEISMLRSFGPSPASMREFASRLSKNQMTKNAKEAGTNVQKAAKEADRASQVFNDMFDIHDRRVTSADGNWMVQAISGFRTVAVGSKLGGVAIPSFFGDLANAKVINKLYGLPQAGVMRRYFDEVAAGRVGNEDAIRSGIIFENGINLAASRVRYFGALDGPHISRVFSDQVYRIGLAAAHTQVARNAVGKQFLGFLHDTKKTKFDDHPLAAAMLEMQITAKDWDQFRKTPSQKVSGVNFLRPIDMFKAGNAQDKEVAEKFGNLLQQYIRMAVPDTTLRSRRAVGEHIDPNSALGQINRTMLSLLSFPISLHFNQLRKISELPNVRDKMAYGAAYVGTLTVAGAFITQAKALASGSQLYDMSPVDEKEI